MYVTDDEERRAGGLPDLGGTTPPAAPAPPATGGGTGAAAPAGGARAAAGAQYGPARTGTGFVGLAQYLGANQGGAQNMAGRLAGNVQREAGEAENAFSALKGGTFRSDAPSLKEANPELYARAGKEGDEAALAARALQTNGGIGAALTQQYGSAGGYGSGMRGFDTFLAGAAGGDKFQQLGGKYGGLDSYLGAMAQEYQPSAPGSKPFVQPASHSPKGNKFGEEESFDARPLGGGGGGGVMFDDPRRKRRTA